MPEKAARDQHSSVFQCIVSEEEKSFMTLAPQVEAEFSDCLPVGPTDVTAARLLEELVQLK